MTHPVGPQFGRPDRRVSLASARCYGQAVIADVDAVTPRFSVE